MKDLRKYGSSPFEVAVLHGGPGAPGEMAPVAGALSRNFGVLEPLQTRDSIGGQVQELQATLEEHSNTPVTLIGWSWGAWLAYILAARHPRLVKKVILVSSGPFEHKYAERIMPTRLARLSEEERREVRSLLGSMGDLSILARNKALSRIGSIFDRSDCYRPIPHTSGGTEVQYHTHDKVWSEASKLRESGQLLDLGRRIICPVVAIHGDYDPHPAEGVEKPLSHTLEDFEFILLKHCGHHPWYEKEAKDTFYRVINEETG